MKFFNIIIFISLIHFLTSCNQKLITVKFENENQLITISKRHLISKQIHPHDLVEEYQIKILSLDSLVEGKKYDLEKTSILNCFYDEMSNKYFPHKGVIKKGNIVFRKIENDLIEFKIEIPKQENVQKIKYLYSIKKHHTSLKKYEKIKRRRRK